MIEAFSDNAKRVLADSGIAEDAAFAATFRRRPKFGEAELLSTIPPGATQDRTHNQEC
jgi:hypothetical protein